MRGQDDGPGMGREAHLEQVRRLIEGGDGATRRSTYLEDPPWL